MATEHNKADAAAALEALKSIQGAREDMLAKVNYWPWWYDAGYASACALLVGGQGYKGPLALMSAAGALVILFAIMRKWQADTGVWVNGYSPKRARWVAYGFALALVGLMGLSIWFGRVNGIGWVPVVAGATAAALGLVGMRLWMRQYRKDVADLA